MKTFEKLSASQLCLVQHFNGIDYSQVARSLSKTRKEEQGTDNKNVQKYCMGGTDFEKG